MKKILSLVVMLFSSVGLVGGAYGARFNIRGDTDDSNPSKLRTRQYPRTEYCNYKAMDLLGKQLMLKTGLSQKKRLEQQSPCLTLSNEYTSLVDVVHKVEGEIEEIKKVLSTQCTSLKIEEEEEQEKDDSTCKFLKIFNSTSGKYIEPEL